MLVKLTDTSYINSDYIINLYLLNGNDLKYNNSSDAETGRDSWIITARMIDGSMLPIMQFPYQDKQKAEEEYVRLIRESNRSSNKCC